jgi:hypothetical protein
LWGRANLGNVGWRVHRPDDLNQPDIDLPFHLTVREAQMANKDKGGRAAKKPPAKDLKQKRREKKAKKAGS